MSPFFSSSLAKLSLASVNYYLDDNVLRARLIFIFSKVWLFFYSFYVVPPSIAGYLQVPENVSIVEKNPISLVCEASGIPLPSITWLKNGWPVTLNNSVRILSGTKVVVIWGGKSNPNQGRG